MSKTLKVKDLIPDDANFNTGTEFGNSLIDKSLSKFGAGRSILIDKNNRIIAGNKTIENAAANGFDDIVIVETTGEQIVAVKRTDIDLNTKKGREMALADNATAKANISWDAQALTDWEMPLAEWGVALAEPSKAADGSAAESEMLEAPEMLDDIVFPSDNEYEIPTLDIEMQATTLLNPVMPFGSEARTKKGVGTYHFYVEDYRFESIWQKPQAVIKSGCQSITEPNISLFNTTPKAWAIFQTFRKRWIARFLQQFGVKVFVDLNVNQKFYDLNMFGVPKGWKAFSTRAYVDRLDALEAEIDIAKEWSGGKPFMFVVGGGQHAQVICQKHNVIYVENWMTERKEAMKANG